MANQYRDYGDLRVTMTKAYDWVWWDKKSGASRNVTIWHPKPQGNLRALGSVGIGHYDDINNFRGSLLVSQNPNKSPEGGKPAVANPTGFTLIWKDRKSGATYNGAFWRPTAPSGYTSVGDVGAGNWDAPSTSKIWCVRSDLVRYAKYAGSSFWDDKKSGAESDCSLWDVLPESVSVTGSEKIPVVADCFRAVSNYNRPDTGIAHTPVLPIPNEFRRFDASLPKITPTTIPHKGDQYDRIVQCKVELPYVAFFDAKDRRSLDTSNPFCTVSREIAWFVGGVWVNDASGSFQRSQRILFGVTKEQSESMSHTTGVEISSSFGLGLVSFGVSLNYQFTYESSASFSEYSEKEVTETFDVPSHTATVLFSKHLWIKAVRADGSEVLNQIESAANDDVHFGGTTLPQGFSWVGGDNEHPLPN